MADLVVKRLRLSLGLEDAQDFLASISGMVAGRVTVSPFSINFARNLLAFGLSVWVRWASTGNLPIAAPADRVLPEMDRICSPVRPGFIAIVARFLRKQLYPSITGVAISSLVINPRTLAPVNSPVPSVTTATETWAARRRVITSRSGVFSPTVVDLRSAPGRRPQDLAQRGPERGADLDDWPLPPDRPATAN